jgi:hypothetical protein
VPPLRAAAARLDQGPEDRVRVDVPEAEVPPEPAIAARWSRLLPPGTMSLSPVQRELLAVAMVLAVEPAAPTAELRAWARAPDLPAGRPIARSDGRPVAEAQAPVSTRIADRPSTTAEPDQPSPLLIADDAPSVPFEPSNPGGARTADPVQSVASGTMGESIVNDTERPVPAEDPDPPTYPLFDRWPEAVWSAHATACYLLNLLLRFEEEPSWADLLRLARRVLRGRPGARRRARDPLWGLFQYLSGEGRILAAHVPTWRPSALGYLAGHRLGAAVFSQPGRIAVTRTHVDVILDLEQIDLTVRISGLDQNPGWVPSLGRIVSFHFEDVPGSRP